MKNNNKDYILNVRISKNTYNKIKEKAEQNRESISNIVRKVIDDSTEIISCISDDFFGSKNKTEKIITYYKGISGDNIKCSKCSKVIKVGSSIIIGESKHGKKYYFCSSCK